MPGDSSEYPFEVKRIARSHFKPLRFLKTMWAIFDCSRDSSGIFANGLFTESAVCSIILRKRLLIKIVGDPSWERSQNRGWFKGTIDDYQSTTKDLRLRLMDTLRNWAIGKSHLVITPSRYLKSIVSGWGVSSDRIKVIYNSCPIAEVGPAKSKRERSIDLIVVARLTPWKGIDAILRAVARFDNVRLSIVGDGPLYDQIRGLITELNLDGQVTMHGKLPHSQVLELLRSSKIFILNSSYEGMPHVLIEAFVNGCEIISSDSGGSRELIEILGQGRIFRYNDVDEISSAIGDCLRSEDTIKREYSGKELDCFSESMMFKRTEEAFQSCFLSSLSGES